MSQSVEALYSDSTTITLKTPVRGGAFSPPGTWANQRDRWRKCTTLTAAILSECSEGTRAEQS